MNLGEDHPHLVDRRWVADRKIGFGAFDILLLNITSEVAETLDQSGYGHRFSAGGGAIARWNEPAAQKLVCSE